MPNGKPVRNRQEVLMGRYISQKSEAQLHLVPPLPAEQLWVPHLWSGIRNLTWHAMGRIQRMEKCAIHGIAHCQFEGQIANESLKESLLSPFYTS